MKTSYDLKLPFTFTKDLSAGSLSVTTSFGREFQLKKIEIHSSVGITEDITITKDSRLGANYDTVIRKKSLSNEQSFIYRTDGGNDDDFRSGDEIKIECTNANGVGIVYGELTAVEL